MQKFGWKRIEFNYFSIFPIWSIVTVVSLPPFFILPDTHLVNAKPSICNNCNTKVYIFQYQKAHKIRPQTGQAMPSRFPFSWL